MTAVRADNMEQTVVLYDVVLEYALSTLHTTAEEKNIPIYTDAMGTQSKQFFNPKYDYYYYHRIWQRNGRVPHCYGSIHIYQSSIILTIYEYKGAAIVSGSTNVLDFIDTQLLDKLKSLIQQMLADCPTLALI